MAVEGPKIDLGWCISGFDARNGTLSGTTRSGPSGSGQFLAVQLSTTVDKTVNLCTIAGMKPLGILQNKPSTGIAADVCIFGVSKVVAGSTAIAAGQELETSTLGAMIPFSSATGIYPCGRALEAAATSGQIFSALIYGAGVGSLAG